MTLLEPKVLVATEDPALRSALLKSLSRERCRVFGLVGDTTAAYFLAPGAECDVLVLDMTLPGADFLAQTAAQWRRPEDPAWVVLMESTPKGRIRAARAVTMGASDAIEIPEYRTEKGLEEMGRQLAEALYQAAGPRIRVS